MQQHYEVINLHNIIKTQEAKIHELKQQLRIANQREESRYGQFMKSSQVRLDEKEKMIEYLKLELDKQKTTRTQDLDLQRSRYERDNQQLEKQIITHKKKNIQLQGKLKRLQNETDTKFRQLTQNNALLSQEIYKLREMKNNFTMEVTKLNHFYKNSIFEIAKRKETLLWVEKFTEYLDTSESKEKKTLTDINNFVTGELENLRSQLSNMVNQIIKCDTELVEKKTKNEKQIISLLKKVQEECEQLMRDNEDYWNNIIKQEKQLDRSEQTKMLRKQLADTRQSNDKELKDLKATIKNYEAEKKTLILGFQQLRSLNQQREANYKQEIKYLKKTIEDLIQSGQQRDKDFQIQIKNLSSQIQQISQRYYENIDMPQKNMNNRILDEAETARQELIKIQNDPIFRNVFTKIQTMMDSYCHKGDTQREELELNSQIQSYILNCNSVLQTLMNVLTQKKNSYEKNSYSSSHSEASQIAKEMKDLQFRQKYNKSMYQATLAKKHLAKMHQHYAQYQKKSMSKKDYESVDTRKKLIQLRAENQALMQNNQRMKQFYEDELKNMQRQIQLKSIESQKSTNSNQILQNTLLRLKQTNEMVTNYIKNQYEHFRVMKENTAILVKLLVRPMQSLDILAHRARDVNLRQSIRSDSAYYQVSNGGRKSEQTKYLPQATNRSLENQEIQAYKQIILKKSDNNSATQKLITELIKVIRQNQQFLLKNTHRNPHRLLVQGEENNQTSSPQKKQNTKVYKMKGAQKKIKQLQQERVKERQEFVAKLQKLQQSMRAMSTKQSKANSLKYTLNKFESSLQVKISEIVKKMHLKLDKNEVNTIKQEVISDMRSKLQQANLENEGLRKQMSILYGMRKQETH